MNKTTTFRIILFGFKSCGKTYFGKKLSTLLSIPFIDTDQLIEEEHARATMSEQLSCRTIHMIWGEEHFRNLETHVLKDLIGSDSCVIAVGGGAILNSFNRSLLEQMGHLVYLSVDKHTLKQRILGSILPSYLDPLNPEGSFETLYAQRKPLYEQVPATQIDISNKTDDAVLEQILSALKLGNSFVNSF